MRTILLFIILLLAFSSSFATMLEVPAEHPTIQAAINASSDGDTVLVQPGTYYENVLFMGRAITVASLFLTTGNPDRIEDTVIHGSNSGHVVRFANGEGADSRLTGFKVTGGNSYYGGGLYFYPGASPVVRNLIVSGNYGEYGGGAAALDDSDPQILDSVFRSNTGYNGAGLYCNNGSDVTLRGCSFFDNNADFGGALLFNFSATSLVERCLFTGNHADYGGGIYCFNHGEPNIVNCTFNGNTSLYGGAIFCGGVGGDPTILNCIMWGDTPDEINYSLGYPASVSYSDVENGQGQPWFGNGCIEADPVFVDAGAGDFRLSDGSPCIDTGDPGSPLDPDGTVADMGAFYRIDPSGAPDAAGETRFLAIGVCRANGEIVRAPADRREGRRQILSARRGPDILDIEFPIPERRIHRIDEAIERTRSLRLRP